MSARAVKAAAVMPAANRSPPFAAPDPISATAPIPSASVDSPTSVVSRPQMTKRTPTRSTWEESELGNRVIGTNWVGSPVPITQLPDS